MTTEAQTQANRANSQKSTGPRTPEGKAKVAQNALKHGLLAKQAVVVGEDTDDFDLLRDRVPRGIGPGGADGVAAGGADRGPVLAAATGGAVPHGVL